MKEWNKFFLAGIILLAIVLRFVFLGSIPAGLTNDEADIGYDAYSILHTGHDQWGKLLPLTSFKGFGDYRLPLYTYLVIPSVQLFNLTSFAVRLPSALFGVASVILVYFVVRKLFEKSHNGENYMGLAASLFMAISPWSIGIARIGIESNVAIAVFLAGVLSFLYAFKNPKLFILSGVLFAVTLFAYTSYTLFTPMALIVLFLFMKKDILKHKKMALIGLAVFIILVIPLFIFKSTAGVRASQITFINSEDNVGLLTNLNDRRGSCSETFPSVLCKLTENKQKVFINNFFKNYLNHFSLSLLFLNGTTTQYSILPPGSLFQTLGILFIIFGLLWAIKSKQKNAYLVIALLLIAPIPDSLTGDGHYSRASNMIPFIVIMEGVGLVYLISVISHLPKAVAVSVYVLLFGILFYSVLTFALDYFSYFPKYFSNYSQYGYEPWAKKIQEEKTANQKIYLSRYGNDTKQYVYYLFYTKYDPHAFQEKKGVAISEGEGGWVSIDRIGNLYFVDRIPSEGDLKKEDAAHILLVTSPTELPKGLPAGKGDLIVDKNGNGVFQFVNAKNLLSYYATLSAQLK